MLPFLLSAGLATFYCEETKVQDFGGTLGKSSFFTCQTIPLLIIESPTKFLNHFRTTQRINQSLWSMLFFF